MASSASAAPAASTVASRKIVLAKPTDWELWLSFIKNKAELNDVWDLINPHSEFPTPSYARPAKPPLYVPATPAAFDPIAAEYHRFQLRNYKELLSDYDRQQKTFSNIIDYIHETLSSSYATVTRQVPSHPWSILRALKLHIAPSDEATSYELEKKYHRLAKGPGNRDVEAWVDEWHTTVVDAKKYKIEEVMGDRPVRDFLIAIEERWEGFASIYRVRRNEKTEVKMSQMLEQFRLFVRQQKATKAAQASDGSSFATTSEKGKAPQSNPTFAGHTVPTKGVCLCGSRHPLGCCYYIVPTRRPEGWEPIPSIQAKIDEAMKDKDTRLRAAQSTESWAGRTFESAKQPSNQRKFSNRGGQQSQSSQTPQKESSQQTPQQSSSQASQPKSSQSSHPQAFFSAANSFAVSSLAFSVKNGSPLPIQNSWILDNGSNIHVCNRSMRDRFIHKRDGTGESLAAGAHRNEIEAYGEMIIRVPSPEGMKEMRLLEVHYVPNFMTNIVALRRLRKRGVDFDSYHLHLHTAGKTMWHVKEFDGHYLLEDNRPASFVAGRLQGTSTATRVSIVNKVATSNDWHRMLGHVSSEAIQHLQTSAEGVIITDSPKSSVPKTHQCEPCALAKAHRVISRSPAIAESSEKPFHRITYDLMNMTTALNGHLWVSHFACYSTDFNMVYTHAKKSDATGIIKEALHVIAARYNGKVVFFRSDGEKALGIEFLRILAEKGITWEPSASESPEQNGHSERKGGILAMKARALRIDAGLPIFLWNEVITTAGYLANRTPMAKHGWKTPYELVTGEVPNLAHLKRYGCKAYTLDKHIPRRRKLQERAHIGHLIGYNARNIFRIWIPSQRKVIRTRDVMFDEEGKYDAHDIDLIEVIQEPMIETVYEPENLDYISHIREIESDDDLALVPETSTAQITTMPVPIERTLSIGSSTEMLSTPKSLTPAPPLTPQSPRGRFIPTKSVSPSEIPPPSSSGSGRSSPGPPSASMQLPASPSPTPSASAPHLPVETAPAESSPTSMVLPGPSATILPGPSSSAPSINPSSSAQGPTVIGLDLDTGNILPEGVKRKRQPRKHAFFSAASGGTASFHQAFSALTSARNFYLPSMPSAFTASIQSGQLEPATPRLHRDNLPPEPKNFRQLTKHPHRDGFIQGMKTEVAGLQHKETWDELPYEDRTEAIPTMWVFKYKFDQDGFLAKYRARLCARGDLQRTQQDTYAATLAARIFRALMAIVAAFDLETRQYDAINAFANSPIDEITYCRPPDGWVQAGGKSNTILRLNRALYGLRQSPALWYRLLSCAMTELGLEVVAGVECLFHNQHLLVFFFVDDIVVMFHRQSSSHAEEFHNKLFARFEMRALGELQWFLGINILRDRDHLQLSLSQSSYIEKLMTKFKIEPSTRCNSPLPFGEMTKYLDQATSGQIHAYQQKIGSINFAAVITRPDVALAASKLSEFLTNPSTYHMDCADHVLKYLGSTKALAISYRGDHTDPEIFLASSDASFADNPLTRRSSQGYAFKLFSGMIDWKASKQKTVTTSSTEAELLAISEAGKELIWWMRLFQSINFTFVGTPQIQCDNQQTIRALTASNFSTKLRHVDIHRHWLRQETFSGRINIEWVPTARMLADGLTKPLPGQRHAAFVEMLGMKKMEQEEGDTIPKGE